jgi:hypothetical protein
MPTVYLNRKSSDMKNKSAKTGGIGVLFLRGRVGYFWKMKIPWFLPLGEEKGSIFAKGIGTTVRVENLCSVMRNGLGFWVLMRYLESSVGKV